ncbi:phosphoribosyl-ATP pyrophosphatase 1 [Agaricicola taiwanensis]|uniref:Phosphoribosyl-ATP pyrophosphatase n=1 Tax=Agaricicola taiwanensis TaxID=591372 RepID=A0A8J2VJI2_9RHOB|nr:phosphoribosyl-ATP diphosphatase [Agaricicola taiwanensis]GGE28982.1 phosphoribosyl-ATP pyrophosphatase 1 [Agaricicola taiwanensis]
MTNAFTLEKLEQIVAERSQASGATSYTRQLLDQGVEKCAKKFGEEAVEAVLASVGSERDHLIKESADVLYHLLVLLAARQVSLAEVYAELDMRTARSGLAEKASRPG